MKKRYALAKGANEYQQADGLSLIINAAYTLFIFTYQLNRGIPS
jgi:hypothetical protein